MTIVGTALSPARIEMQRLLTAPFGMVGGKNITLYTLRNARGSEAAMMNLGATMVSLKTPDRNGALADIVLGYDDIEGYVTDRFFFGGTIGRYANRIANGTFILNGTAHQLPCNDGPNHLHGGPSGFHKVVWQTSDTSEDATSSAVEFSYVSPDGEEGYPGNLAVHVTYRLTDDDELWIAYHATSDRDTVINVTNHSYFNLAGEGCGDILEHRLFVNASEFTPVNSALIPTGNCQALDGTPLEFSKAIAIGARIHADDDQLRLGHGYDHNFVIRRDASLELNYAARLCDPKSGRAMDVYTTEPGIQFYSGNFLDGSMCGKTGKSYGLRSGLCLETQHFPDSPNQPAFPSTVLRVGEQFHSRTAYKFTAK